MTAFHSLTHFLEVADIYVQLTPIPLYLTKNMTKYESIIEITDSLNNRAVILDIVSFRVAIFTFALLLLSVFLHSSDSALSLSLMNLIYSFLFIVILNILT